MDEALRAQIRRYKRNLEISGKAMILFGLWSVIKFILIIFMSSEAMEDLLGDVLELTDGALMLLWAAMSFIMTLVIAFNYYLGMSAVRYARGEKKSRFFLVITTLDLVGTVCSLPLYFMAPEGSGNLDTGIASFILDVTTSLILFDILYCIFRVKKLEKKAGRE